VESTVFNPESGPFIQPRPDGTKCTRRGDSSLELARQDQRWTSGLRWIQIPHALIHPFSIQNS
jgi:hypothetical protein